MSNHRHPHASVANQSLLDNFTPASALEALHTEIVDIEALAHAAGEAVTRLPRPTNPDERRALARVYTLVTRLAADVTATVTHGDALIAALGTYLATRRSTPPDRPKPTPPSPEP
jgi:hypothetical protein